jgi:hypothetical protein
MAASTKKTRATPVKAKNKTNKPRTPRVRKLPEHRSLRLTKRVKLKPAALPSAYSLLKQTNRLLFGHKKLFFGIILANLIAGFIFVQGFGSTTNFSDLKEQVESVFGDDANHFKTAVGVFGYALAWLPFGLPAKFWPAKRSVLRTPSIKGCTP